MNPDLVEKLDRLLEASENQPQVLIALAGEFGLDKRTPHTAHAALLELPAEKHESLAQAATLLLERLSEPEAAEPPTESAKPTPPAPKRARKQFVVTISRDFKFTYGRDYVFKANTPRKGCSAEVCAHMRRIAPHNGFSITDCREQAGE